MQGYSLTEQFLGMVVLVMAMMAVIPGLLAVLRLGREEAGGRLESLLALPVTRLRLLASFTALSVLVSGAAMLVSGLGLWLAASVVVEEGLSLPMMLRACLAQLPAMLAMTSASVLVMGFRPRWSGLVWGYLGYSFSPSTSVCWCAYLSGWPSYLLSASAPSCQWSLLSP